MRWSRLVRYAQDHPSGGGGVEAVRGKHPIVVGVMPILTEGSAALSERKFLSR